MTGGNAPNMVADHARAVIKADSYDEIRKRLRSSEKTRATRFMPRGSEKILKSPLWEFPPTEPDRPTV